MGPTLIVVTCFSSVPFDFLFCSDVGQKGFFMSKCCTLRNSTCRLTLSRRYFAHAPQICPWHRKVFRSLSIGTLGDDFGYLRDTCGLDAFAILPTLQSDGHVLHRRSLRSADRWDNDEKRYSWHRRFSVSFKGTSHHLEPRLFDPFVVCCFAWDSGICCLFRWLDSIARYTRIASLLHSGSSGEDSQSYHSHSICSICAHSYSDELRKFQVSMKSQHENASF